MIARLAAWGRQMFARCRSTPLSKPVVDLDTARRRVRKQLVGFTADFPGDLDIWEMQASRADPADFPVPELVLVMLRNIMGFRWAGPGEKVRWTIYCSVDGEPVAFELRKFGFTILRGKDSNVELGRIVGQLRAALKVLEGLLDPVAQAQIDDGRATIANHFDEFDSRYKFFRRHADEAFARAENLPGELKPRRGRPLQLAAPLNYQLHAEREGFFHSVAMVDAYFSRLEHRLILLRAFTGQPLESGELRKLLTEKWDEKLKRFINIDADKRAPDLLGRLRRVKERIRNPFAHGGVENDRGSLFFHFPGVGPIPANFSRFKDSVRFSFLPIKTDGHQTICALFDELDTLLTTGPLAAPHRLLEAGVDPAFDSETLSNYAEAIAGAPEELETFLDEWGENWARHTNMDY